jgi:hypothetical protein
VERGICNSGKSSASPADDLLLDALIGRVDRCPPCHDSVPVACGKELTVFHATACSCGLIRRVERTLPAHVHPHESTPARPAAVSC